MSKTSASVTPLNTVNKTPNVNIKVETPAKLDSSNEEYKTTESSVVTIPSTEKNNGTATIRANLESDKEMKAQEDEQTPATSNNLIKRRASKLEAQDNSHTKIRMMCAHNMLEKSWFVTITTVLTLYALFGDDFRLATSDKPADIVFYVLSFIALLVFIIELVVASLGQPYYFEFTYNKNGFVLPSFYFWLDVAATVSLYPDVVPLFIQEDPYSVPPSADAVKAGRASRAGTRAGRIIRLVRIVRMVKLVKAVRGKEDKIQQEEENEPSAVGSKLSEVTIRKIIMIVLLSIIILPILDGSLEGAENLQHVYGLQELHRVPMDRNTSADIPSSVFAERVRQYGRDVGKVVHIQVSIISCYLFLPLFLTF
jgi:hypothetical protein